MWIIVYSLTWKNIVKKKKKDLFPGNMSMHKQKRIAKPLSSESLDGYFVYLYLIHLFHQTVFVIFYSANDQSDEQYINLM